MRKYLLAAIMAASALVPAAAFAQDQREWHGGRQGGGQPGGRPAQAQPQAAPQPQAQPAQQSRGNEGFNRPQFQGGRNWQGGAQPQRDPQRAGGGGWRGNPGQPGAQPQGFQGRDGGGRGWQGNPGQPGAQPQGFQGRDGGGRGWQGNPGQPGGQPQGFQGRDRDGRGWQGNPGQPGGQPQRFQGRDGDGRGWQGGDRGRPDWQGRPGGAGWQGNDPRRDDRGWQGNDPRRDDRGWQGDRRDGNRGPGWIGGNDRRDWNRDWRQDNRYNYNAYRSSNRGAYHLPRYYAPSGWGYGYRRFGVGLTLNSILYNQSYWIDDADYYRLPPAYGPYRWVRYYNDALLVDIDTGRVVDTVYDIFW